MLYEVITYQEVEEATLSQIGNLIHHSIISTLVAQKLHSQMVPRPFLSTCIEKCIETGVDLSQGGAKYNVGPVLTGIGLAVVANSLAVIKKLVFEDKVVSLDELNKALDANWQGYESLRAKALDVPKYGNDDDYVDSIARTIANYYYRKTREYRDIFGSRFNTAVITSYSIHYTKLYDNEGRLRRAVC